MSESYDVPQVLVFVCFFVPIYSQKLHPDILCLLQTASCLTVRADITILHVTETVSLKLHAHS